MPLPPLEPSGRIARRDLALHRQVWRTFAGVFAFVGVCVTGIAVLWPNTFEATRLLPFAALCMAIGAVSWTRNPPTSDSWLNQAVILLPPICTALGVVAFAPHGIVPLPAALFVGVFGPSRLAGRRALVIHFVLATLILLAPLGLADLDRSAVIATASVIPAMLALGFCTVMVLEASEAQGSELQRLVRSDPLTGVGNQRLLDERLDYELARHRRTRRPLSILALDVDGLAGINERLGRGGGDAVLQRIAAALEEVVSPRDTIVRRGDDEFCLLLPDTSRERAEAVRAAIREALGQLTPAGRAITGSMGIAVFPSDAVSPDLLLEVADTRLSLDKAERHETVAGLEVWAPTTLHTAPLVTVPTEPRLDTVAGFTRVSRDDVAGNRAVWLATSAMYGLYAVLVALACTAAGWPGPLSFAICGAVVLMAAWVALTEPPPVRSLRNHLVTVLPVAGLVLSEIALPQISGALLGAFVFGGVLAAVRLTDRRAIAVHVVGGTLVAWAVSGAAIFDLAGDGVAQGLAIQLMALTSVVIAVTIVLYLEVAEDQGEELERIVRRDDLTDLGNRRLLAEQLDREVRRHARVRRPLTLVAIDLNGFTAINEAAGPAAGDELLQQVGVAIAEIVGQAGLVVRQGADEFRVMLPETSAEKAVPYVNAIRVAIAKLSGDDRRKLSAGIGVAAFPDDAPDAEVLQHVAGWRLRDDARPKHLPGGRRATDRQPTAPAPPELPVRPRATGTGGPLQVFE